MAPLAAIQIVVMVTVVQFSGLLYIYSSGALQLVMYHAYTYMNYGKEEVYLSPKLKLLYLKSLLISMLHNHKHSIYIRKEVIQTFTGDATSLVVHAIY